MAHCMQACRLDDRVAAGAVQQENLVEFAGLYRRVGLPVPQTFMLDPGNMSPPPDMGDFDLSENLEKVALDIVAEGGSAYDLFNSIDTMMAAVPEEIQAGLACLTSAPMGQI